MFAPQLLLEAAMAERGGFASLKGKAGSAHLSYWQANGLGDGGKVNEVKDSDDLVPRMLALVERMAGLYATPDQPYRAVPWSAFMPYFNDYLHLERIAEWSTVGGDDE